MSIDGGFLSGRTGRATTVAIVLAVGVLALAATSGARSARHVPPSLTGTWTNPAASGSLFQLHSSANRKLLTMSWRGVYPHQNELSSFTGRLNRAGTAYSGTVHNVEGAVRSTGTMTIQIKSANRLSTVYIQNGRRYLGTLVRGTGSCGTTATAPTLAADGKSSESIAVGATANLAASDTGTIPSCQLPVTVKLAGTQTSGGSGTISYSCAHLPCSQPVSQSSAGTWRYVATLYGAKGQALGTSSAVTVTWSTPISSIMVSSSGAGTVSQPYNAGPGSTTWATDGTTHNTACGGAAVYEFNTGYNGGCKLNQEVDVQGDATISASINQALPSGQQLVIVYDSGNPSDPEFQKCLPGYSTSLGCVIAATSGQSTQVDIPIPTDKSNWGGVHYLTMIAEYYPATSPAAELDIALCQSGNCG